jgi:putative general porin
MTHFRKIASLCAVVSLGGGTALADDYRAQVDVSVDRTEFDDSAFDHGQAFSAVGTYYLAPVRTDGLPLAEAAFLNRSSYASAAAVRSELDDEKIDIYGVSLGYYLPDTIFFGRLGFTYADDLSPGDRSNFNGTFGVTPFAGLLVTTDFDENGWDPNVRAKYVGKMANSHYYAVSASAVDPDDGDTDVGLDFDYFFDNTFSVGAGFGSAADTFSLRAQKFFTPSFAVEGRLSTGDVGDGFGATISWRF